MVRPLLSLMDILKDQVQKTMPISNGAPKLQIRLIYQLQHNLLEKKDCLANNINKQALIKLIANCMQQKGCHVIHAEGDADVDIAKAAITASSYSSTTLIGKDMDLLVLLLHYYEKQNSNDLFFRSDKDKITPYVYNIRILKQYTRS